MYSQNHALLSAIVAIPVAVGAPTGQGPFLWIYMLAVGTGIDADHFLVARFNRGDWKNIRRCIQQPSLLFRGQTAIFDWGDLWRDQRLLSHLLIGFFLVVGVWPLDQYWAFGTAVTVYTHLVADLYSDMQTREEYMSGNV
mgnify:FL=1|jgi:hypothetical protein